MARRLIIAILAAAALSSYGQDRATLLKRERQFTQALEAMAARLLNRDDALQTLNRRIKAEQHQLYRLLRTRPEIQAIQPLRDTNPVIYRQKYLTLRRQLLQTDEELETLQADIRRLQAELARRLSRRPEILVLRRRLAAVQAELESSSD